MVVMGDVGNRLLIVDDDPELHIQLRVVIHSATLHEIQHPAVLTIRERNESAKSPGLVIFENITIDSSTKMYQNLYQVLQY